MEQFRSAKEDRTKDQQLSPEPFYHHRMRAAAKLLGVSRQTLARLISDGKIVPVSVGHHYRILDSELRRYGATLQEEISRRVVK